MRCGHGGRNNFPVSAGTGGKPGASRIRSPEFVGDFPGQTRLRHHAARQRGTMFKTRDESPTKTVASTRQSVELKQMAALLPRQPDDDVGCFPVEIRIDLAVAAVVHDLDQIHQIPVRHNVLGGDYSEISI